MKIYLSGGWGYGNIGDNVILKASIDCIREIQPTAEIIFTSYSADELRDHHGIVAIPSIHALTGIRTFSRTRYRLWNIVNALGVELFTRWSFPAFGAVRDHLRAMATADVVVLAGGGYFNDEWRSMMRAQFRTIRLAAKLEKRVVIAGQTLGPFSERTHAALREALSMVDKIGCRDAGSFELASTLLGDSGRERCRRTADMANLLVPPVDEDNDSTGCKVVGVMIQNFRRHDGPNGQSDHGWINSREQLNTEVVDALFAVGKGRAVKFQVICSTAWDFANAQKIHELLRVRGANVGSEPKLLLVDEFVRVCQEVDVMLSTNMHPVIVAATAAKPSVALSYSFKLDDYMAATGQERAVFQIDNFTAAKVSKALEDALDFDPDDADRLCARVNSLKDGARANYESVQAD